MNPLIKFITLLSIISLTKAAINPIGIDGYQYKKIPNNSIQPSQTSIDTIKTIIRNDHMGNYVYGFETSDGIVQRQAGEANGSKRGYYSYVDPDGKTYTVCYIADENGYRIVGDPKLGAIKEIQCPYDKDKRRPNPLVAKIANTGNNSVYVKPQIKAQVKGNGYGYVKPLSSVSSSVTHKSLSKLQSHRQVKKSYPVPEVDPFLPPYV
ncbi:cuticle protein 6-like [Condylostylus longicornis]|uniref:cuticle protein 6-like n=1 Tax=Condylostylus longicornis TaxID=2530218 RepID=UPI00244DA8E0|nr:cuticle protein 6-like [Condylostylus longicornis]